jgi:hypothetical protein
MLFSAAGRAIGQVEYGSGLLHLPLGGATLDPATDRRVPVRNIGSSGQDGVEVRFQSVLGGEATIDVTPLYSGAVTSGEIKIRHKGWDGLIYGTHRASPPGAGGPGVRWESDFADMGALSVRVRCFDDAGNQIDEFVESGSMVASIDLGTYGPGEPVFVTGGAGAGKATFKEFTITKRYAKATPKLFLTVAGGPRMVSGVAAVELVPIICITEPCPTSWPNLRSLEMTATGMTEGEVSNAALDWSWGVCNSGSYQCGSGLNSGRALVHGGGGGGGGGAGGSRITEELQDVNGDGAPDVCVRATNVSNDLSTAVTISVPAGAESASVHGNCCRGHVIIMKAFDDAGHEMRLGSFDNPATGGTELTPDFSTLGAAGAMFTAYDAGGVVLGSGFIAIGGTATINYNALCGPGAFPQFVLDKFGKPYFIGCGQYYDLVAPGQAPIAGVASVKFEPVGAVESFGTLTAIGAGSSSVGGGAGDDIVLGDYRVVGAPQCDSIDFNGDGIFPDNQDAVDFIDVFAGAPCPTGMCGDLDFNNDGIFPDNADITKYLEVLAGAPC